MCRGFVSISILENWVELIGAFRRFIFGWGSDLVCFRCAMERRVLYGVGGLTGILEWAG